LDAEWSIPDATDLANGVEAGRKVALIQLAYKGECWLFRVGRMKRFPKALANLLEDEGILKSGVAVDGDARRHALQYLCLPGPSEAKTVKARGFT
jgi:hypothetical protein